jgi:hypothetical protein
MFGRNGAKGRSARPSRSEVVARPEEPTPAASTALLAIVGHQSRVEDKFEIADSIEIECEIGGELTVGGRLVIGERGVVVAKIREQDVHAGPRPVHLVEDKRLGAQK